MVRPSLPGLAMKRTGKKPAQKPPLSPALRAAISNIAEQGDGSDDEAKVPVGPGAGASKANGGGGSAGQVPTTPIMVMGESQLASFTASILTALESKFSPVGAATSASTPSMSSIAAGVVPVADALNMVQFEAGKSQASSLKWHLMQVAKIHYDEIPSLDQSLIGITRALVMWLTDLQAQATKFKVDLMLGLGEDKTPTPLSKAEAAARYIAGTPLRGDGQREISAVEFDSCQVFAAKDLQQTLKALGGGE